MVRFLEISKSNGSPGFLKLPPRRRVDSCIQKTGNYDFPTQNSRWQENSMFIFHEGLPKLSSESYFLINCFTSGTAGFWFPDIIPDEVNLSTISRL